jgi:uncharacterized membrane protein YphA (DoxX/SURF4 family)
MRLVAAIDLFQRIAPNLRGAPPPESIAVLAIEVGAGLMLLVGFWTPIAGTLVAVIEFWNVFTQPGDPWCHVVLGTLGGALALLGPGAWSVDSHLFGRKRIDIKERHS